MEEEFYYYSCGSIPGKGPRMVKDYLESMLHPDKDHMNYSVIKRYKFCLKLDVHHFFQSIDRDIMMDVLRREYKDKDVLNILSDIIYSVPGEVGLPIGYYTSQWLSNLYLTVFDYWVKRDLLPRYFKHHIYIRYVDDMVIVAGNKRRLKAVEDEINKYLKEKLKLDLKYSTYDQIFEINKRPIDFVGYKFSFGKTQVRNRIFRRALTVMHKAETNKYTVHNLSSYISYKGWLGTYSAYKDIDSSTPSSRRRKLKKAMETDKHYIKKIKANQEAYSIKKEIQRRSIEYYKAHNEEEAFLITVSKADVMKHYNYTIADSVMVIDPDNEVYYKPPRPKFKKPEPVPESLRNHKKKSKNDNSIGDEKSYFQPI